MSGRRAKRKRGKGRKDRGGHRGGPRPDRAAARAGIIHHGLVLAQVPDRERLDALLSRAAVQDALALRVDGQRALLCGSGLSAFTELLADRGTPFAIVDPGRLATITNAGAAEPEPEPEPPS